MCLSSASKFPELLKIWYFIGNHTLLIALGWLDSNMSYSLYKSKPNYAEWSWLDDQDLHMIMQCCVIYYRRLLKWRLLSTMYFDLDCNPLLCIHGPNANLLIDNNFSNSLILGLRLLWTTPWAWLQLAYILQQAIYFPSDEYLFHCEKNGTKRDRDEETKLSWLKYILQWLGEHCTRQSLC